ncbi:DUF4430 domain-containing protein [Amphibacillus sp. MSJ-3]|uniref:DUF4430 domain-containing protein n=1 Tax=Amphibacillus sp. MSJ-3 TaxID=2841505 RepID=UPI001C0EC8F5|nr:DUF4430 domain-containing protein [Amphibacillus sp. MSJ-3]MBU5593825.1 DUF4430 domain-containing protein [Amphibacillus sp. MSJ-3]
MKFLKLFLPLMLATNILFACGSTDPNNNGGQSTQSEVQQLQIELIISQEHGEEILAEEELEVEEGSTLMDILKDNFDIEEDNGFITAINGIKAEEDEPYAWMYTINGEMASVGAADYKVENGDVIEFDFQSWE